jgi:hypothetical protein
MGFIVVVAVRIVVADEEVLFEDNFDKGLSPKWSGDANVESRVVV